jgi:hypothetical protein
MKKLETRPNDKLYDLKIEYDILNALQPIKTQSLTKKEYSQLG